MNWAEQFIRDHGEQCIINGATQSYVSLRKVGSRTDLKMVENFREGLILADSGFTGGDILDVGSDKYICTTAKTDQATGQIYFQAAKVNTSLTIQRYQETYDNYGNVTGKSWNNVYTDVPAYAGMSYQQMNQEDPGLINQQFFEVYLQNSYDVQLLDRLFFVGRKQQVDNIDPVSSPGNLVIYASNDTRS